MKKVVVTGGTGFLGKRLSEKLNELGYDVTALGRNDSIGRELEEKGIKYIHVDLSDLKKLEACTQNTDILFHCAAKSSLWGKYEDFFNVNVIGTKNIIEIVQRNKIQRLIYTSSPTIYYDNKDFNEFNNLSQKPKYFINYYAETKWLAQEEIDKAFMNGINTISIIPRGIFGPGDTSIFPRLLKINSTFGIPLINNGQHMIEITYIENVVDSLILCIDTDKQNFGKKFFITNNEKFKFKDLVNLSFKLLNIEPRFRPKNRVVLITISTLIEFFYKLFKIEREPPLTRYSVEILYRDQTFDIKDSVKDLGYVPHVSVAEGLKKFEEWWNKNGKKV